MKLQRALMFEYAPPKGGNRVEESRALLRRICERDPMELTYDVDAPQTIEEGLDATLPELLDGIEEVIVDVSSMTKLLLLVVVLKLARQPRPVRVVYSEAADYGPTWEEYQLSRDDVSFMSKFPSRGFNSIIRSRCLSSTRMQGQPVALVAFTSFNEQLVRHMLGTISPHRLLFINGRPPRDDFRWREHAMQEIHQPLLSQYVNENPVDETGHLTRVTSTLDYRESYRAIDEIWRKYGAQERIICAATGSKMQMLGLALAKLAHSDIHVEYPTPDSYFFKGMSRGIRSIHDVYLDFPTLTPRLPE